MEPRTPLSSPTVKSFLARALRSIAALVLAVPAAGQESCGAWNGGFTVPGVNQRVRALASFDPPGSAPARLIVAGDFTHTQTRAANHIAEWDGSHWSTLGEGIDGPVHALLAYDDGGEAKLIAGGSFAHAGDVEAASIACWNGSEWSSLSSGLLGAVWCLAVFDDGTGSAVYAGGEFTVPGDAAPSRLARWNGTSWSAVGGGLDSTVLSLCAYDDGTGEVLYVGGSFTHAGGLAASYVARWNGSAWSDVGGGAQSSVWALAGHGDASGVFLYAGGDFADIGGVGANKIARWNGTQWSTVGGGFNLRVSALRSFNDGSGPSLWIGGSFTDSGGQALRRFARWRNGVLEQAGSSPNASVDAIAVVPEPGGNRLYAGGVFATAGETLNRVGRWNGTTLVPLGTGQIVDDEVIGLASFDHGTGLGAQVFIAGAFTFVNGIDSRRIVRWSNEALAGMAPAVGAIAESTLIEDFAVFQPAGASSAQLYACGNLPDWQGNAFNGIARVGPFGLQGTGLELPGTGSSMVVWDDGTGPALWIAGFYYAPSLGNYWLLRWDGVTVTPVPVAGGITLPPIVELEVFDAGSGPELYFAGAFHSLGGAPAGGIGRFDGTNVTTLDGGASGTPTSLPVVTLATLDLGDGPALYATGTFTQVGTVAANSIARWNGSEWSALGSGLAGSQVRGNALAMHDASDGGGLQLVVGGRFSEAGGVACANLARWDGQVWRPFFGGTIGEVKALVEHDDGTGVRDLFAGGAFFTAGGRSSIHLARFETCGPITTYCSGDGADEFVETPCPCGNFGGPGRGCAWSGNPAGAGLAGDGTTRPDTLVLRATGMPATSGATVFWKGNALLREGIPWGDGLRCIDGALIRLGTKTNVAGAAQYPEAGNASVSARGQTPVGSGAVGYYQTTFRNAASFCTPFTYNATNAVRVVW